MYSKQELYQCLSSVIDPELDFNIIELGLVYDASYDLGVAFITMTLSTPACPLHELILGWVREALLKMDGIKDVQIKLVFEPAWDISMASESVRQRLAR